MKSKTYDRLTVIGFTLAVLTGVFFTQDRYNFLPYTSYPILSAIRNNAVQEVMIDDGKQISQIVMKDNIWYVKKDDRLFKADQDRVQSLLTSVSGIKKEQITALNKSEQEKYGIGKKKILIISPDNTLSLYIGNEATLSRNYIRINGEDDMFVAAGFNSIFEPRDYRDFSVGLVDDETMVNQISITDNETINLKLTDNEWFSNDRKINKESVSFYINDLRTLKADDIVKNTSDLSEPQFTIKLTEKDDVKNAEFFKVPDGYLVKVNNNDNFFKVKSEEVMQLEKKSSDFPDAVI